MAIAWPGQKSLAELHGTLQGIVLPAGLGQPDVAGARRGVAPFAISDFMADQIIQVIVPTDDIAHRVGDTRQAVEPIEGIVST